MKQFGLIGFPLAQSFSKKYFSEKFIKGNIADCVYENYPIESIAEFPHLIQSHPDLKGLNVTIPYKKQVIQFLNGTTDAVKKIGACNCIKITDSGLYGHNTDAVGFERSLKPYLKPHHNKALILGTGGAGAAIKYALDGLKIESLYVSREAKDGTIGYQDLTADIIDGYTLIINTTPLGMFPKIDAAPNIPYRYLSSKHHLFDAVYNPQKTLFLAKGEAQGASIQNGYEMLLIQADEAWKIWNEAD